MFDPGRETKVTVNGKVWTFSKLGAGILFAFRDWIRSKIGDPFAVADRYVDKLPPEQAFKLIKEAEETKEQLEFFSLKTPLALRFIETEEGATELFRLQLVEHHPDITSEQAFEVLAAIGVKRLADVAAKTQGQLPPEKNS